MGINPADFRKYVIRPTLTKLGTWSPSLENLLLGSAAAASQLGISLSCEHGFGVYKIAKERKFVNQKIMICVFCGSDEISHNNYTIHCKSCDRINFYEVAVIG